MHIGDDIEEFDLELIPEEEQGPHEVPSEPAPQVIPTEPETVPV